MADSTDKFKKATNNFSTTLNESIGSGDTTIALTSVTNLPTDTGIVLVIDRVDGSGNLTPTLREYVKGVVSSNNLINVSRGVGNSTAQAHTSGAVVECVSDQVTQNDMVDGILVQHNQDGTHGAITSTNATLTTPTITQPTIHTFDGWISATETWTYVSADSTNATYTFKISGVDKTGILTKRDRIKLTQTTVKYFIVTNVTFSTDTTVTIYGGTDYTLANATITSPNYSHDVSPNGFPVDPTKWTQTLVSDTSGPHSTTVSPVDTIVNPGSLSGSVPIGAWTLTMTANLWQQDSSSGGFVVYGGLSTANNSLSDQELIKMFNPIGSGVTSATSPIFISKQITVTSATTYYCVASAHTGAGTITVGFQSSSPYGATVVKAISAYL